MPRLRVNVDDMLRLMSGRQVCVEMRRGTAYASVSGTLSCEEIDVVKRGLPTKETIFRVNADKVGAVVRFNKNHVRDIGNGYVVLK